MNEPHDPNRTAEGQPLRIEPGTLDPNRTADIARTPPDAWAALGGGRTHPDIPRYQILGELGEGGMGVVYRARDTLLPREVALKLIRPETLTAAMRLRFLKEAQAVASLDHPNIVKVYDTGEVPTAGGVEVPFLVLELVPRGSLTRHLDKSPMAPAEAAQLVRLLALAVAHAHQRGIVHRDLKPDNVLLAAPSDFPEVNTPLGCPKITDFGLARQVGAAQHLTSTGAVMGTPTYMAPEQADGLEAGPPADVYSLGVILYRVLTGRVPFQADSLSELLFRIAREPAVPVRQVVPSVPEPLAELCGRCLAKRAEDRPTAAALAEALGDCEQRPGRTQGPLRGRQYRSWWLAALLAVGILAAIGLWRPRQQHPPPAGGAASDGVSNATPERAAPVPLRIQPLRVHHIETLKKGKKGELSSVPTGVLGEARAFARYRDAVTVRVELAEPAYFYMIGFNFDGGEQLLWPEDQEVPPPRAESLVFPSKNNFLYLDEEGVRSGLQAFAVAAGRKPLPPYGEWKTQRGPVPWQRWPAGEVVWAADERGVARVGPGLVGERKPATGTAPALDRLCEALRTGGVEVVELIAFGVKE